MTQWYYSDYERNRHGPVEAADLAALHADGQLDPATLVWREGMAQWQPWHTVMAEVVPETAHPAAARASRSEEHTSELQSLIRISYAVFCLKKKRHTNPTTHHTHHQQNTTHN